MGKAQRKFTSPSLDGNSRIGLVQQVADHLSNDIKEGKHRPGERVPSVRQFAKLHGVSVSTTVEAYERLVAKGTIVARRGAGFYVAKGSSPTLSIAQPNLVLDSSWLLSEVFADERVPIKTGCGWLPGKWLDTRGLHLATRSITRLPSMQMVGYGHPFGYAPLRQFIAESFSHWTLEVSPDQVVMTHGATQAMDLIVRTLVRRGDTVLVEDPGYCNLIAILNLADVNVVGVPRLPDGVDIEALDALARKHRPKLFFCNPLLQNPTGTSYSPACAMRVLQVAERSDFWVVEDDLFRELAQATDPMLAALDGLKRVIYVSGYSKTIAPSLRLGYIVCQRELAREIARAKMVLTLTNSEIVERLAYAVLTEGHHRRHVERLSVALFNAQARVSASLEQVGLIPFANPRGGLFYWAKLDRPGTSAKDIADRALKMGIWLAPGDFFHLSTPDYPWFRFNVAHSDAPELLEFFRTL